MAFLLSYTSLSFWPRKPEHLQSSLLLIVSSLVRRLQRVILHSVLSTRVLLRARGAAGQPNDITQTDLRFAIAAATPHTESERDIQV